ncbi:MAG: flippase-like domain-containing protein [Kiritimatiellales bacterium]|nr:flippase-like domain-containing protein [Kiritimatiellales bacterium]
MQRIPMYAIKGIGIVLFIWILLKIDIQQASTNLMQVSVLALVAAIILFPVIYLIKSYRWHVLTSAAGADTNFKESMRIYMSGLFLGIATPGKLGEAIKIPALVNQGLKIKDATSITVIDRALDVLILGIIGIWASAKLISANFAFGIGLTGSLIMILILLTRKILLPNINIKSWLSALILTVVNWCVYFLQLWILSVGFDLQIVLPIFISIMTLVGIISILPIAPAGLGTRDAAIIYFFGTLGIAAEKAITFSFTIFILTLFASSIGAYFWIRYPLKQPHEKKFI